MTTKMMLDNLIKLEQADIKDILRQGVENTLEKTLLDYSKRLDRAFDSVVGSLQSGE
jgi:flagellar motor switch protein FliG